MSAEKKSFLIASSFRAYPFLIDLLATGFYSGRFPVASGTAGSLLALVLVLPFREQFAVFSSMFILAAVITVLGIAVSNEALRLELYSKEIAGKSVKDPKQIVIDEFAGMFVTLIGIAFTPTNLICAFFAFRFFDVTKLFPIRRVEALPRGWGIVLDDVLAGVYANIAVRIIISFI